VYPLLPQIRLTQTDVPVGCTQAPADAVIISLRDVPTERPQLHLSGDPAADRLLSEDPLALLIGLVLDQQVPLERAFAGPWVLRQRLGTELDAAKIAAMAPDELAALFVERPALHRFPGSMAARVQDLCHVLVQEYGADAAAVWTTAGTGDELFKRVRALPGFGERKARILVALLGKQLGIRPKGWEKAAGPFGQAGSLASVADVDSPDALLAMREHRRATNSGKATAAPVARSAQA
jgi:uncharacterized HhH-GPD family protein